MSTSDIGLNLQPGQKIWLSQEILDWPATTQSMLPGHTDWQGHYAPWEHANESLSRRASEQDRASAIFQLRRALEFRDKALRSVYSLDKIPGLGRNAYPGILSDLNITLPIMRRKLIDLRNEVAHDHTKSPPEIDRCREYSEFTWYFLKSTDHLLSSPIGTLAFDSLSDRGSYSIDFNLENWIINLTGVFDLTLLMQKEGHDDIGVDIFKVQLHNKRVYFESNPHTLEGSNLIINQSSMLKLLKMYFAVRY